MQWGSEGVAPSSVPRGTVRSKAASKYCNVVDTRVLQKVYLVYG